MWIDRILASRTTRAVELTAAFTEERQRVLAENVANIDTPDYHAKQLTPAAFQKSLSAALERSREDRLQRVQLRDNAQFTTDADGHVQARPGVVPAANVLFHDGTNARLETLMSDASRNALWHELALNLLKQRYGALLTAIRGRTG
jgi:flagellar basal-body rod protein FlgB